MRSYSVYIHIPFCKTRCSYCDFITSVGNESWTSKYVSALCSEIEFLAASTDDIFPVHTVYFGGGTPSILPTYEINRMLVTLEECFELYPKLEVTLEANPGTLTLDQLSSLKNQGINRLSLGMQSANPDELSLLGRRHDVFDTIQAVKWARLAGFDNLNLDLIFDIPSQRMENWEFTLDLALKLCPDHFSLYGLTLEAGTRLNQWVSRGILPNQDPDLGASMYELTSDRLTQAGYQQYEISNWSKPGYECRHNIQYWQNFHYFGFGLGAHGFVPGYRTVNLRSLTSYIQSFQSQQDSMPYPFPQTPGTQNVIPIDEKTEISETMMMGLRLTRMGISNEKFQLRFGRSLDDQFGSEIKALVSRGLLTWNGDRLKLTSKGRLLGNQVFQQFV